MCCHLWERLQKFIYLELLSLRRMERPWWGDDRDSSKTALLSEAFALDVSPHSVVTSLWRQWEDDTWCNVLSVATKYRRTTRRIEEEMEDSQCSCRSAVVREKKAGPISGSRTDDNQRISWCRSTCSLLKMSESSGFYESIVMLSVNIKYDINLLVQGRQRPSDLQSARVTYPAAHRVN